ncbi:MAG: hypothetical protein JRJ85_04360 [Deltaproteobacteria bacterium]|nr:hypothetical protein [Deltaproteobacteria bacterium]
MSDYNREQIETISMVRRFFRGITEGRRAELERMIRPYLDFREEVARFQDTFFSDLCTGWCFNSRTSACCNREGIATFFGDMVVNIFLSGDDGVEGLLNALHQDPGGFKCVYLSASGCLWRIKPIVCEMFLCDHAKETVLERDDQLREQWETFRQQEKAFTWPDRPVLFDALEDIFIREGYDSPLMYFHRSPGLLRVKAQSLQKADP